MAAKDESKGTLKEFGLKIVEQIKKGKNPEISFPLRNLSNIIYDEKSRTLKLGNKKGSRSFFNVAHSKKFLQTVEVASVIKEKLIDSGKHSSLRDVFYMTKRTIPGTDTNLVDEQTESDKAIEDLEVITTLSREQMHVNANKNGSVAGKVIIEDRGDTIDWSKLGSGGWSIPSIVEDIKFKKVSVKYILYMEKVAVWERLHEDKFWDKTKAEEVLKRCKNKDAVVSNVDVREFKHKAPTPFDLTSLQTEAYKFHGITPSNALQSAQKLYLAGLISYPRTSSQKIPEEMKPNEILEQLKKKFPLRKYTS